MAFSLAAISVDNGLKDPSNSLYSESHACNLRPIDKRPMM